MKAKHIKFTISKKINDWLESIDDPVVREIAAANTIVTGGCIVSMLLGQDVNDFDLYLRTKEATLALANYYVKKFMENPPQRFKDHGGNVKIAVQDEGERVKIVIKSSGIAGESGSDGYQYFEQQQGTEDQDAFVDQVVSDAQATVEADKSKPKYRPMFLTANAITLSHKVQVILRFYGEPSSIHKTYDFVHCTCYWDSASKSLELSNQALESILAKDLRYMGQSLYPICAMIRVRKFLQRGWRITAGQLLKIAWDISKLNLDNLDVLEDQLIGVDAAYFTQVIAAMRERDPSKVDAAYLMEVIDRIF